MKDQVLILVEHRYLLLKKFSTNFKKFPLIPMHLSLYNKPQCHTLSNALEISRKTPLTSKLELASKAL